MINKINQLARPEIVALTAYASARSENTVGEIWLDANECPWDLSQQHYNRYPEPQPQALRECLAQLYQVAAEKVLITRGSDEGIDLLVRTFCRPGQDEVLICPPTYGMYQVAAAIQGARVTTAPLNAKKNFSLDPRQILAQCTAQTKLLFLCSPNNPTGNLLERASILTLAATLAEQTLVVVDEAYFEFADNALSLANYLDDYPNLVVLRTLSKAYGLAGLRCGATLAHPTIIALLKKVIAPYPIARPVVELVLNQLSAENLPLLQQNMQTLRIERNTLAKFLMALPFVNKVWPSDANFLLVQVADAPYLLQCCRQAGIIIRNRSQELGLANCVRITLGTPEENTLLKEVLLHVEKNLIY